MASPENQNANGAGRSGIVLLLVSTVFLFAAWPPLVSLLQEGVQGAFKYFANDSFYYLAIAQKSASLDYFTFDGVHPTNAFHPLWEAYLRLVNTVSPLTDERMIFFAAGSSVWMSAVGAALFSWAIFRLTGRFAVALLASVPGLFYLVMPHFGKDFAAHWNFANSMESPLSVFFFGWLLAFLLTGNRKESVWSRRDLLLLSVLLSGLVMTRLDDVFLIVPFGLYALYSGSSMKDRLARGVCVGLVPAVVLMTYMIFNQVYSGHFLPTSGLAKAEPGFALLRNAYAVFTTLFPFLDFMRADVGVWKSEGWRVVQMLAPMALAAFWLYRFRHAVRAEMETLPRISGQKVVVVCLASYVLMKGAYNFAMVGLWGQGNWYYVVSIMVSNLLLALFVTEVLDRARDLQMATARRGWLCRHEQLVSGLAAVLLVMLVANSATDAKRNGNQHHRNYQFWSQRAEAQALIDEYCGDCGVVSFDDGIVAFSLDGVSTLNGIGLALDEEARIARAEGRMLDLAWERGHRLLVTVNYPMAPNAYSRNEALRAHIRRNAHLAGEALEDWHFELAFDVPGSNVNFVRFAPGSSRLTKAEALEAPERSVHQGKQASFAHPECQDVSPIERGRERTASCG